MQQTLRSDDDSVFVKAGVTDQDRLNEQDRDRGGRER